MNILVFGASGRTGHELTRGALDLGHSVTAFVRDPTRLGVRHENLTVVSGDLIDEDGLAAAVAGQDAVICTLGVGRALRRDPAVVEGVGRILEAMRRKSVRRFVYLSFIGVSAGRLDAGGFVRHIAPRLLRNEIADHEEKEELVRQSGLDWTILRAPKLTNGPRTGAVRLGEGIAADRFLPRASRADVAAVLLRHATDPAWIGRSPSLLPSLRTEPSGAQAARAPGSAP